MRFLTIDTIEPEELVLMGARVVAAKRNPWLIPSYIFRIEDNQYDKFLNWVAFEYLEGTEQHGQIDVAKTFFDLAQ